MPVKKSVAMIIVVLAAALLFSACGGKTGTPALTTTSAPTTSSVAATTTTIAAPAATTKTTAITTSAASKPVVSIDDAKNIKMTSATLSGSIVEGQGIDEEGFEWGTASGKYDFSWTDQGTFNAGAFSHFVTQFTEGTTYYFRGKAHNKNGWGYSAEKTFRTLGLPKITAISVSSAMVGSTLEITVTGTDFADTTALSLGNGVTVSNFKVTGDTKIVANIVINNDAATGKRSLTVTTPLGSGTLADCFTVQQQKMVLHTFLWNDSKFNEILHLITSGSNTAYSIALHDGNQITLTTTRSFLVWVEMRNGKLCFTNVQQSEWDSIFSTATAYMSYDSAGKVITINGFPDSVLKTMFDVPQTTMPEFNDGYTTENRITLKYYSLDIVS
jgi:hypothetical protein